MSKLHRSFKNIRVPVRDAALALFEAKPWREVPDEQQKLAQAFVDAAAAAYSVPTPEVNLDLVGGEEALRWYGPYEYAPAEAVIEGDGIPQSIQASQIILRKWSIVNLFLCFRAHLLNSGVEARENAEEPYGWAFSLFYSVKPAIFRARVREGRIGHPAFGEIDLYSRNTLARAVAAGVVSEEGEIIVSNFPKYLDDLESGALTVEQLLESLSEAAEGEDEEDDVEPDGFGIQDEEDDEDSEIDVAAVLNAQAAVTPNAERAQELRDAAAQAAENAAETQIVSPVGIDASDDGLDGLGIVELRRLSRGRIVGGYSLRKPELVSALREAGVRASDS